LRWAWNIFSHTEGETQAEEDSGAREGQGDRGVDKTT
jgi:hypothetical protein